ncbi:hypothetical protein AB0H12_21650 [Actinosynnema sp. NPDC023794]
MDSPKVQFDQFRTLYDIDKHQRTSAIEDLFAELHPARTSAPAATLPLEIRSPHAFEPHDDDG